MGSLSVVMGLIFEAVLDEACWPRFLKASARELNARSGFIMAATRNPDHRPCHDYGLAESTIRQYYDYFHHVDPWWAAAQAPSPGQFRLLRGEDLIADRDLLATEFYQEYLRPNDIRYMRALLISPEAPGASPFFVSWQRGPESQPFETPDDDYITRLAPSLLQAERLGSELVRARVDDGGGDEPAVFVLGRQGWLLQTNDRGRRMLNQGLFESRDRALRPASQEVALWLHSHLNSGTLANGFRPAINGHLNGNGHAGGNGHGNGHANGNGHGNGDARAARSVRKLPQPRIVSVLGAGGSHYFEIRPCGRVGGAVSLAGAELLLVVRPAVHADSDSLAQRCQRRFGWTPTEFDTVVRLFHNQSTHEIAQARICSVETVRTHLKHAKRKAGVRRQVELVTLMMHLESDAE